MHINRRLTSKLLRQTQHQVVIIPVAGVGVVSLETIHQFLWDDSLRGTRRKGVDKIYLTPYLTLRQRDVVAIPVKDGNIDGRDMGRSQIRHVLADGRGSERLSQYLYVRLSKGVARENQQLISSGYVAPDEGIGHTGEQPSM